MKLAVEAADAAGEIIRAGFGQVHQVELKGVGDLVSEVDRQADQRAASILGTDPLRRPILSEELTPNRPDAASGFWVVDPLDGTSAFLFQTGTVYSSVLIALWEEDSIRLGVVHFPLTGEWFFAERGKGAFRGDQDLRCDSDCNLRSGWVELNHYGDVSFETAGFRLLRDRLRSDRGAALVTQNAAYSGVAVRVADPRTRLVAAVHDNNPESVKQGPWDIAAPKCILEEAGGLFLNLHGEPASPFVAEPMILASNRRIADSLLELVGE